MGHQPRQPDKQHETTPNDNTEKSKAHTLVGRRPVLSGLTGVAVLGLGGVAGGKSTTTPADQGMTTTARTGLGTGAWEQLVKLLPPDNAEDDLFGHSVSLSGDGETALIGAFTDDDNGIDSGSAYVFTKDDTGWSQTAKLTADDGAEKDLFGRSVTLDNGGETALVGAINNDGSEPNSGSAYVFTKDDAGWSQTAKLTADDDNQVLAFGSSVAFDCNGETALIGTTLDDPNGAYSGAAYIFTKTERGWSQTAKLTADDETEYGLFGGSVALDNAGRTALVGDSHGDENGGESGSAYIFTMDCNDWSQTAKLLPTDNAAEDRFGYSVSLNGDGETALIGAYADDDNGRQSGSAYIFTKTGARWNQTTKLTPDDGDQGDKFGGSVALDNYGETALIGALNDASNGTRSGSAYILTKTDTGWSQTAKLTANDGDHGDKFGYSVSLNDASTAALVGAPLKDDSGPLSGSAYVFGKE